MGSPSDQPAPTPLERFTAAVYAFDALTAHDDVVSHYQAVQEALLDVVAGSQSPNSYVHAVSLLNLQGMLDILEYEPGDALTLEWLKERVRFANMLLP